MAKALGIGGVFFKSKDPKALGSWYREWLGFEIDSTFGGTLFSPESVPQGGYSVWAPFSADAEYFDPSGREFMINLIVDDLAQALKQVEEGGGSLVGEAEELEFGQFGWFTDPDGNKVELWQPA